MSTVGKLSADDIGAKRIIVQHEGSTLSGLLTALDISSEIVTEHQMSGETRHYLVDVKVTLTIGAITIGPLRREHPCEVIA